MRFKYDTEDRLESEVSIYATGSPDNAYLKDSLHYTYDGQGGYSQVQHSFNLNTGTSMPVSGIEYKYEGDSVEILSYLNVFQGELYPSQVTRTSFDEEGRFIMSIEKMRFQPAGQLVNRKLITRKHEEQTTAVNEIAHGTIAMTWFEDGHVLRVITGEEVSGELNLFASDGRVVSQGGIYGSEGILPISSVPGGIYYLALLSDTGELLATSGIGIR